MIASAIVALLLAGPAGRPIPDPVAQVCGKDSDCPVGKICYETPDLDPRWACVTGCRPKAKAPRCPPKYTCEKDTGFSFTWYRCRAPNGGPFLDTPRSRP